MRLQHLAVGLLGLASSSALALITPHNSGNAVARGVGESDTPNLQPRVQSTWDAPRLKLSEINKSLKKGDNKKIKPTESKAKLISKDDWFVKTDGIGLETELQVYQTIDGKGISPDFFALIVDSKDASNVIGFGIRYIKDKTAKDSDKPKAVDLITQLHYYGWAHTDAHKKNFIKDKSGNLWLIDYGQAALLDSNNQEEDYMRLDEEFGIDDEDDGRK
ncbi:hypothetical protein F4778DRAFT_732647 [Xylariomycetidae sp. FL2044]|nr:hypothetical protein F4778DRAFT_732647 [Xylariomycetidae sp. FL2044]